MRISAVITSLAIALLPWVAVADWAELRDLTKVSGCGLQCGSLLPIFENDSFDDICNKLVEDGCASAFITGKGGAGSAGFGKADGVSCEDAAPLGQLTCTNAFRAVLGSLTGFGRAGGTQAQQKSVYTADGTYIGAINFVGSCIPQGLKAVC